MQAVHKSSALIVTFMLLAGLGGSSAVFADEHFRGVVTDRQNGILLIQGDDASKLVVVLDDFTKVVRTDGLRRASMSWVHLIPGLRVVVEGEYDTPERFIAEEVSFTRSDLKTALAFQATDQRSRDNQQRIEQHAQALKEHGKTLGRHAIGIQSNEEKIVATTGELASRIGNLADHAVIDAMTVYFSNGSALVGPEYRDPLKAFAVRAKDLHAYMFQVQGFASAPGSAADNEKLSKARADAVVAVLQQSGVSLTSIVVPAAMGETQQSVSNDTSKGQAENRRVLVTLLQNKGIAAK